MTSMFTVWNAFLPISIGSAGAAVAVLQIMRRRVLPLVRRLERQFPPVSSYSFLVHDRASGVPVGKSDKRAYIHLRLVFGVRRDERRARNGALRIVDHNKRSVRALLPKSWVLLRQVHPTLKEERVHKILDEQCRWYLDLIESALDEDLIDEDILQRVGQHLHYFANMSQMSVR